MSTIHKHVHFNGLSGAVRGVTLPDVFASFDKSAIFSYPSVTSAISSYHSVNSATVLYHVTVFRIDVQCAGGKVKISEFIFVISLTLKFNKSYKVSVLATQIVPALTRENSVS